MHRPAFVDCHSHVVPSGDDGVASVAEGEVLCREAARRGTGILFATPHVWPHLVLTEERERAIREAYAELKPRAGLAYVLNADGFGSDAVKIAKYRRFVRRAPGFRPGFKLFYHEDVHTMSPRRVMRLRPPPDVVVYE